MPTPLELPIDVDEVAEAMRQAQARAEAAEQARQQYSSRLPEVLNVLQNERARDFPDIKTWDDVGRLAQQDPVRYLQWDALSKREAAVRQEASSSRTPAVSTISESPAMPWQSVASWRGAASQRPARPS